MRTFPWTERLAALRLVGLANAWRAWRYRRRKEALDAALQPESGKLQGVGALHTVTPTAQGARLAFALASLEIAMLAEDVVRLRWSPGEAPPPYAVPQPPPWPPPDVAIQRRERNTWRLRTSALELTIAPEGLTFHTPLGGLLRRETWPARRGAGWRQTAWLHPQAAVFGLGERAMGPNLRPGTYRLWNRDPGGRYAPGNDPLYLTMPLAWVLQPAGAYLIFYDNPADGEIRLGDDFQVRFDHGALLAYLIVGDKPAHIARRFAELTGFPPLPPRWALGYHQSRWGYATQQEVTAVLDGFREHDMPLAALHLDLDYMQERRPFTRDLQRFPHWDAMVARLHAENVHLVTLLDPGIPRDPVFPPYAEGRAAGAFCRLPTGEEVAAPVWPGWCAFPDFTAPEARRWWGEQLRTVAEWGVDGLWLDMNEPTAFVDRGDPTLPLSTHHALEGKGGDHRRAHNLYGLQMARATFEAWRRLRPERRPWLLSRSGWVGLQRYAWTWTGDTESTWAALRQTVGTVIGLGLSGLPFSGPDVGGFAGAPDGELYLRWLQLAALLPFFRTHASILAPPREPWRFAAPVEDYAREALRFRQRLMPYLYTLAWQAHTEGVPLVRPLWWDEPRRPDLWTVDDAFLLGAALLVAPALVPAQQERFVTLPSGVWYDFHHPERPPFWRDAQVVLATPLAASPLLVRAGALLPLEDDDVLTLWLGLPPEGSYPTTIYYDAGDGEGPARTEAWTVRREGDALTLRRLATGAYPFPYAHVRLHLAGGAIGEAWVDGHVVKPDADLLLPSDVRVITLRLREAMI